MADIAVAAFSSLAVQPSNGNGCEILFPRREQRNHRKVLSHFQRFHRLPSNLSDHSRQLFLTYRSFPQALSRRSLRIVSQAKACLFMVFLSGIYSWTCFVFFSNNLSSLVFYFLLIITPLPLYLATVEAK